MIPTFLISKLIREHCKVALGGDGGDELFGGYRSHDRIALLEKWSVLPYAVRKLISLVAIRVLPDGWKGKEFLKTFGVDLRRDLPVYSGQFDLKSRKQLIRKSFSWKHVAEENRRSRIELSRDLVFAQTHFDFENYLAEDILVKVDRASMANSLEVRAPFLDYRLVEYAYGRIASDLKATPTQRKIVLKALASKLLPSGLDITRKQGFGVPISDWLQQKDWIEYFSSILLQQSSMFDSNYVGFLLRNVADVPMYSGRLFGLALFELWRRKHSIGF